MNITGESLSFSMARRTLMQRYDGPDGETAGADDLAAQQLLAGVMSLSKDGAGTQQIQVTQALLDQQIMAAQDVRNLWPQSPQMQIAAEQMSIKAGAFGMDMIETDDALERDLSLDVERPRMG